MRPLLRPSLPLALLACPLLMPSLQAQGCGFVPDADPATGPASIHPFGSDDPMDLNAANQALVFRIPQSALPNQRSLICALGFSAMSSRTYHFDEIRVRLGQTQSPNLNAAIPLNMTGFTTMVMQTGNWDWNVVADRWSFLGLSTNYPYDPAHGELVVEIVTVGGHAASGSGPLGFHSDPSRPSVLQTAWRFQPGRGVIGTGAPKIRVCWDASDLQAFGGGCAGSNGQVPRLVLSGDSSIGGFFQIGLRDVPASSTHAFLIVDYRLRGLPFDLGLFGATGCEVRTFWDLFFQGVPLSNGSIDIPLQVPPDPTLQCGVAWCQWIPSDPGANSLGYTVSSFGRILIGS